MAGRKYFSGLLAVSVAGAFNPNNPVEERRDPYRVYYDDHITWGVSYMQGKRSYMEDYFSHVSRGGVELFGVYDGHGNDVSIFGM